MTPLLWGLVGAGAVWLLGVVTVCIVDRETTTALLGFLVAALAAPVMAVTELLRRLGLFGAVPLDARALESFARMKRRGGGRAFALFYSRRRGVIFVRRLRDNEPVPPIRVRSATEREDIP